VCPNGLVSIVSDTWSLWNVLENIIPELKEDIMGRDGKVVIRPDSGTPEDIICGDVNGETELEKKGVIEILWDIFGGTINSKGYKVLDSHIGAIYGDSITTERAITICERLKAKGFASSNIVLGIGSYTYNYVTRDTYCFALKATYSVINGEERLLFKNPVTDTGIKKSQRGMVVVVKDANNEIQYIDNLNSQTIKQYSDDDLLEMVFKDGKLLRDESLSEIRERLNKTHNK
jgi:nicotinamide phosphoribosyltransferase